MSVHGLGKPYTVFEAEGFIGEGANRTNINDIADKVVVEGFLNIGRNFSMISPVEHTMHAFLGYLVCGEDAAVAEDAAGHVKLDIFAEVMLFESAAREFVAGTFLAMLVTEVLQVAFAGLVADRAIEGVVKQQKFHHAGTGIEHAVGSDVLDDHAIHHRGTATGHQLGHRAGISG